MLAEIADAGGNAVAIQASVSNPEDVKRLFAETKAAFGRLDILVNNAGVFKFEAFECISVAEFNREFSTNVLGPILTIQEAIKQFGFDEGRVINISSLAGSHSLPNGILYSATKAAVENLTQGLSAELGSRRIRVNAIAPGYTRSEGTSAEGLLGEESIKHYISITPLGRLGEPKDLPRRLSFWPPTHPPGSPEKPSGLAGALAKMAAKPSRPRDRLVEAVDG